METDRYNLRGSVVIRVSCGKLERPCYVEIGM